MNNHKISNICIFIISLFIFSYIKANTLPLVGKTIYIDPGHGGIDPGTVYHGLQEKEITLYFSKILGKKLERLGANVLYIRILDYDLSTTNNNRKKSDLINRVRLINESNVNMYISIHVNSEQTGKWYGPQIFYTDKNNDNIKLAKSIYRSLNKKNLIHRKIQNTKGLYMYDRITIPGILYEMGFLSNYSDRKNIGSEEYISEVCDQLVVGIMNYLT